ncbi:MAG: hypothetical protein HY897_04490 [Deltaproteobacteria bacterium]|nr:hypothetical protein [Deltaproteobacteria bacterium]
MKTSRARRIVFALFFFAAVAAVALTAAAEERSKTAPVKADPVAGPEPLDDDTRIPPKKQEKKPRRPAPSPEPPYVDDEDGHQGCHHHCFGWFHSHRHVPDEGARKHDGLFLRFALGPGFGSYQGTGVATAPPSVGVVNNPSGDGSKFGGSISLGGVVAENLIFHGDVWGNGNNPRQTSNAFTQFGTGAFGGGLTYYFMPQNVYVSGAVGLASSWLLIMDPDTVDEDWDGRGRHGMPDGVNAGSGIAAYLSVGKEWWVSDNWAMGAALQGDYAHTQGQNLDFNYSGVKVLFTATFN